MSLRRLCGVVLLMGISACGLEGELVGPLTDNGHVVLPGARDTFVTGRVEAALGGASVRFLRQDGGSVGGEGTSADPSGAFVARFPGTLSARGTLVLAELASSSAIGVLPDLPAQPTVFHEERWITLGAAHPLMGELNLESTVTTLMVLRAAQLHELALDALSHDAIVDALDQALAAVVTPQSAAASFGQMVATLQDAASSSVQGTTPWNTESWAAGPVLREAWLEAEVVDLDGDGWQDADSTAFDAALDAAASGLTLSVCYPEDAMRVVFQVELREGARDGNCSEANPFKWAADDPQSLVFFTGGVHPDTPVCDAERVSSCIDLDTIDVVHQALGGWEPNVVPMWDDGTHGDAHAADGIWTISFDLPYWDPAGAPDGAGLRMGYKYTYGLPGQGWTSSEEWPGNQRILELNDLNGDHLVVRRDVFGDEASNKDKVNTLKLKLGGCGTNAWEAQSVDGCHSDTTEAPIDTDADCLADTWPSRGPVVPLVAACPAAP